MSDARSYLKGLRAYRVDLERLLEDLAPDSAPRLERVPERIETWNRGEAARVGALERAAHAAGDLDAASRTKAAEELREILRLRAALRERLKEIADAAQAGLRSVATERKVRRSYTAHEPTRQGRRDGIE